MMTYVTSLANSKTTTFFERHVWKVLFALSLVIGIFGVSDMLGGASDLQNGETILMHSLTGTSWNQLQATGPNAANLIDAKFRTEGASLTTIALPSIAISVIGFRQGRRWAWYVLWAMPVWLALTVLFIRGAVEQSDYGTPVPIISGSILFVSWVTLLALSYRKFFRS
jgi:hypothetical protein